MEFLPFFLVLLTGVLFSLAFRQFHLPWVLALIVSGVVLGPSGFSFVSLNPTIEFLAEIGLIFLMFMAGLETNLTTIKEFKKDIVWLSSLNALIPFGVGYLIGFAFGLSLLASALLGIIFMSSSIAVIIPSLEAAGIIHTKLGRSIVATTIVEDIASLVLLSMLLQTFDPVTSLPLPSFYLLLAVILIAFRYGLPKIRSLIPRRRDEVDLFESEVRVIIVMLIGVVVTFSVLGLHPIIAGFFAGLVLSESIKSDIVIDKLRTISYGIFIPVFFVTVGMQTDMSVFTNGLTEIGLILAIVLGSIFSKFASGYLGARLCNFNTQDAKILGVATTPQLSTTLAVAFTAVELDLLRPEIITAMVVLSTVSTLVAPIFLKVLIQKPQT